MKKNHINRLEKIAREIRIKVVWMSYNSKVGHLGSALSIVDILVVLYFSTLNINPKNPKDKKRDRFILSKGHAASALYAILAKKKFFPEYWLDKYCKNGGKLGTHPDHYNVKGIEWTTGSLGHGLSVGCGMAISLKRVQSKSKVFVLISDAESQEGEIWEAALTASQYKLDNLMVIVDYNKVQAFGKIAEVLGLEPFAKKWESFGWEVNLTDGHNFSELINKTEFLMKSKGKPKILVASTIRGKGVSFMQHHLEWYYHYPSEQQLILALEELK